MGCEGGYGYLPSPHYYSIVVFLHVSFECRPLTGAWIETLHGMVVSSTAVVAPVRGRGLKRAPFEVPVILF